MSTFDKLLLNRKKYKHHIWFKMCHKSSLLDLSKNIFNKESSADNERHLAIVSDYGSCAFVLKRGEKCTECKATTI